MELVNHRGLENYTERQEVISAERDLGPLRLRNRERRLLMSAPGSSIVQVFTPTSDS